MHIKPIKILMDSNIPCVHKLGHYLAYLWRYRNIFCTMVRNDLKGRFKYTILGYFWHLINPLSQIIIYYLIFTVIFGRDIPNYWVYISTGMFAFTFFISSVPGSSSCLVNNSRMITKIAIAREIIVLSRVTVSLITLAISYVILFLLMIITGVTVGLSILFVPIISVLLAMFCAGCSLILSSVVVYVRDVGNAASILCGCLMFALSIMYLAEQRSTPAMELFWSINPLYYYIETIHDAFYWGVTPDLFQMAVCTVVAIVAFTFGLIIFKRLESGLAERL